MKGRRPPFRSRDTETLGFTRPPASRKRRVLPPSLYEPTAPLGDAIDSLAEPPVEITDGTTPSSISRPQRSQPSWLWPGIRDTPLPLRLSEVQDPPPAAAGERAPIAETGTGGDINIGATAALAEVVPEREGTTPDGGVPRETAAGMKSPRSTCYQR
jgi:hypothetical protein